jgi:hypothetical protein
VVMSPFPLDKDEFTVGRTRPLINANVLPNYASVIQAYTPPGGIAVSSSSPLPPKG